MMSCKKMTFLLSQQLDRRLTPKESAALRFHLMMCTGCRNFRDNLAFLRRACQRAAADAQAE